MKAAPLKDKEFEAKDTQDDIICTAFSKYDIKAAVAWLKDKLLCEAKDRNVPLNDSGLDRLHLDYISKKIDEAFPDALFIGQEGSKTAAKKLTCECCKDKHLEAHAICENCFRKITLCAENGDE